MPCIHSRLAPLALGAIVALALHAAPAPAQKQMTPEDEAIYRNMVKGAGMDPDQAMAAQKGVDASRQFTQGKGIVHYHVVGTFEGRANVVGDPNWIGYADVTDRVEIDFDWKLADAKLAGTPVVRNGKSAVKNLRNYEPSCLPPVLKGDYEHYEVLGIKDGMAGALELQVQTSYPAVDVAQMCTGSRKSIPASRKTRPEELTVPSPVMLTMQIPDSDALRVAPDRKSLNQKKAGWTWTFTPGAAK